MAELAESTQLSLLERDRLSELEAVVESGLQAFVSVGLALSEIRNHRLYRERFDTFESYCRERWQFTARRANQLMTAAEIGTMVPIPNERQARELAPLRDEPEQLRETWAKVRELHPEPTAADVCAVVTRFTGYSSARDDWSTPQALFDALDCEFNFTLDVCATPDSAKCASYFTREQDGLAQEWVGSCWMNPPYGDEIRQWVAKAHESGKQATVVCLVPARVDTGWWWDYCRRGDVRFLRGRLRFGGGDAGAPFPSAVVVFPGNGKTTYWERSA